MSGRTLRLPALERAMTHNANLRAALIYDTQAERFDRAADLLEGDAADHKRRMAGHCRRIAAEQRLRPAGGGRGKNE